MARIGDISQLGGVRTYRLDGGSGDGLSVVDVDAGSGLRFTVVPGRALDISGAWHRGVPLAYRTATGDVQGARYEPEGISWVRTTVLGLLVTGGLDNAGFPAEDETGTRGLHGRLSNLAASNVHADGEWNGDEYEMWVQGRVRQAVLFGENLELKRRISTQLGASWLKIHDEVSNLGHRTEPMMVLYHINPGYPVVDAGSRLHLRSRTRRSVNEAAEAGEAEWDAFPAPVEGWSEQVWVHDVEADPDGTARAAVVNRGFGDGLGLGIIYDKRQLPLLNQWKQAAPGEYVTGVEPANCTVLGRVQNQEEGTLQTLAPGETATFDVTIEVLDGGSAIDAFVAKIGS
jgi:hypothetical protein